MSHYEIREILEAHKKWLNREDGGVRADLSGANLRRADLSGADLSDADLSGANGLLSAIDYMETHFERTADGYVAYKVFGVFRRKPDKWEIRPGAVITENVDACRTNSCGCGVNVATLDWVKSMCDSNDFWKVLIRWEWLCGVCVPYNPEGRIRCEKVELIEIVKEAGEDET